VTSPLGDPTRVVWRRCLAYGVDLLLIAVVLVAVLVVAGDVTKLVNGCPSPVPAGRSCLSYHSTGYLIRNRALGWCAFTFVVTFVVAFVVPEAIAGASPGKALLRIRVVRADGSPPGVLRSVLRAAAWLVDGLALVLPVGLWLVIFTPGHRRVGDFVAGTFVVRRAAAGRVVTLPPAAGPSRTGASRATHR
jgi:uncharacterized RDD family membrane protein YckC